MAAIALALTIPFLGTVLGASLVFFMKDELGLITKKALLGFASGVMTAASVWSLLIPSMEMSEAMGKWRIVPAMVGFLAGMAFLLLIDTLTPHLHIDSSNPEGVKSHISKTAMLTLAVTIHNIPEGMAVGVVIAEMINGGNYVSEAGAIAMSLGIAIQNIPEGAIISMPMKMSVGSRWKSFLYGTFSGIVEPIGAVVIILLASVLTPVLPYLLAFAAGAMMYVVVEELIPEASEGRHSNMSTIGFAAGFAVMMLLDVVLG